MALRRDGTPAASMHCGSRYRGAAPFLVQMISPSFLPPTSDFWRRYSRTCAHRGPAWATARAVHPSRPASLAAQNEGERLGRIARVLVEQAGLDQRLTNARDLRALDLHQRRVHDCTRQFAPAPLSYVAARTRRERLCGAARPDRKGCRLRLPRFGGAAYADNLDDRSGYREVGLSSARR